ncbi:MAG: sulfatase family protein [Pseudoclavibacter sp.]
MTPRRDSQPASELAESEPRNSPRPNVLVICADQLKADLLGCYGNRQVRTPNLDALADDGHVFESATVANPTCMPSRSSLLTGRWPSVHGTRFNGIPLDPDANTVPGQLRDAGYRTVAIGKMHLQTMGWPFEGEQRDQIERTDPLMLDESVQDAAPRPWPDGWAAYERFDRFADSDAPSPDDYYGFEHVEFVIGHGDETTGNYRWWASARGSDPLRISGPENALRTFEGWDQVYTTRVPAGDHSTAYVAERTEAHLRSFAENDEPFMLLASFPDPHHPYAVPRGYDARYEADEIELPATFTDPLGSAPEHMRRFAASRGEPAEDWTMSWAPTEEQFRHAAVAEYGLIELMDEAVGRILRTLEETGLADNTVVMFTADHGDFFGDHGFLLKHLCHYRAVTRVPLIIRPTARDRAPGSRHDDLIALPDLAPTMLDLTGAKPYRGIQGRSLVPFFEHGGPDAEPPRDEMRGRDAVLVEEDQPFGVDGLPAPVRMRTLITRDARLTRYIGTPITELYDLRADPNELHNIAGTPAAAPLEARIMARLAEERAALADTGRAPASAA